MYYNSGFIILFFGKKEMLFFSKDFLNPFIPFIAIPTKKAKRKAQLAASGG